MTDNEQPKQGQDLFLEKIVAEIIKTFFQGYEVKSEYGTNYVMSPVQSLIQGIISKELPNIDKEIIQKIDWNKHFEPVKKGLNNYIKSTIDNKVKSEVDRWIDDSKKKITNNYWKSDQEEWITEKFRYAIESAVVKTVNGMDKEIKAMVKEKLGDQLKGAKISINVSVRREENIEV